MQLRKAERKQAKIRLGMSGPSGSGKTYSALKIAYGIIGDWSKVAVIDTERGSADLYSDLGEYNVLPLEAPYKPERYIEAIQACENAGMEVIIVDSITHEWEGSGGCLDIHEQLGGFFRNWAEVTPRHRAFIDSILLSKAHIITTVRTKVDYALSQEGNKQKVEKLGTKEVTREGFEYELTVNFQMDMNHNCRISGGKDRTGLFDSKPAFVPSEETGKIIKAWCESGAVEIESEMYQSILNMIKSANSIEDLNKIVSENKDAKLNDSEKRTINAEYKLRKKQLSV